MSNPDNSKLQENGGKKTIFSIQTVKNSSQKNGKKHFRDVVIVVTHPSVSLDPRRAYAVLAPGDIAAKLYVQSTKGSQHGRNSSLNREQCPRLCIQVPDPRSGRTSLRNSNSQIWQLPKQGTQREGKEDFIIQAP